MSEEAPVNGQQVKPEAQAQEPAYEPPPTREISQTDHLNKQLLLAVSRRIQEGGTFEAFKQNDTNEEEPDDWDCSKDD